MKYYKILFSILVLIVLTIPLFNMNMAEITEQENRTLAKFPELKKKDKLNTDFGKEFEGWLDDRFWGRDQLINARFQTFYKINGRIENEKAFMGDDGWMFEKKNTVNRPSIKKQREKIEKDAEILKRFADKFKGKNIPIYLVLIPEREVLYQKYWERYYKPKPKLDYGLEIMRLLADTPINIVNPGEKMIKFIQTNDIFYKDDYHLSTFGKNILLNSIYMVFSQKELKNVSLKPVSIQRKKYMEHVRNTAALLGFQGKIKIEDDGYWFGYPGLKYLELESKKELQAKKVRYPSEQTFYCGGKSEKPIINKILVSIGGCYSKNIFDFFKPLFSSSEWIKANLELYGEDVKHHNIKKLQKLINSPSNSTIIIITQNSVELINELLTKTSLQFSNSSLSDEL